MAASRYVYHKNAPALFTKVVIMQFIDLKHQQSLIREHIDRNIQKVLDHGQYILGPEVTLLEEKLASYTGAKHCIGVASGTDALQIALMASGIKPDDEVIVPSLSFIATAEVVALLGAKPIFVDVEEKTYSIDHTKIDAAITKKTKAIIPVSLYGQCANMDEINKIASNYGLTVIEDAAQSYGATYKGNHSCNLSDIGCTSFFPSKPLGAYGDGGACFTNIDEIAEKIKKIRVHGQDRRYHHCIVGTNGRLDTIQAAILLAKLDIFEDELIKRKKVANYYSKHLAALTNIVIPTTSIENTHVYAQYTIRSKEREKVINALKIADIPTAVHYPIPLHQQPCFNNNKMQLPITENLSREVFSIPMHPYISQEQQQRIISTISQA